MTTQELELKKMALSTKRIFGLATMAFGFAAVVFAFAALIYTTSPAKADAPATTTTTGKIMMQKSGFMYDGSPMFHILVWNTETGKSKLYSLSSVSRNMKATSYQLPSSPLY